MTKPLLLNVLALLAISYIVGGFSPRGTLPGRFPTTYTRDSASFFVSDPKFGKQDNSLFHLKFTNISPFNKSYRSKALQSTTGIEQKVEQNDTKNDFITEEYVLVNSQETDKFTEIKPTIQFSEEFGDECELTPTETAKERLMKVIYSTCLITANTVGASILVLPDVFEETGVIIPSLLFIGIYLLNTMASFSLSDLSIRDYQAGRPESDLPTSFKDIAGEAFGGTAGNILALLSVSFNYCLLIFGVIRFGETVQEVLTFMDISSNINPSFLSLGYAALLTATIANFSNVSLSKLSSVLVAGLFTSFMALVVPGMQSAEWFTFVNNCGGYFHGTDAKSILASLTLAAPIIIYNMEIQKIVPSVTKLCNFDRDLSRTTILLGNGIPMLIYLSYVYINLGGDHAMTDDQILSEVFFKFVALFGVAIAASMSLSEEFMSFLPSFSFPKFLSSNEDEIDTEQLSCEDPANNQLGEQFYSLPAVLMAIIPPLLIGLQLSSSGENGVVAALDFAGAYITPLFIWIFPAMLAWKQIQDENLRVSESGSKQNGLFSFLTEKMFIMTAFASSFVVMALEVLKDSGQTDIFS